MKSKFQLYSIFNDQGEFQISRNIEFSVILNILLMANMNLLHLITYDIFYIIELCNNINS